jgi:hypothetical protein
MSRLASIISGQSAGEMANFARIVAATKSITFPLKSDIEADITFIGGKEKNKHAKHRKGGTQGGAGKSVVLGIVESVRASFVRLMSAIQGPRPYQAKSVRTSLAGRLF